MHKVLFLLILFAAVLVPLSGKIKLESTTTYTGTSPTTIQSATPRTQSATPTARPTLLPSEKTLQNNYHIFQTYNNCGPAALSMTLSYYGVQVSQKELGDALRPWQNQAGDNDDKSTTLPEMANKAREYNLLSYHRPNGDIALIKQFINEGIPVITRTWLKVNDDVGHYRVVKGYNDATQTFVQDDSLQGKNLSYNYSEFLEMWKKFSYEFVVLARPEQKARVEQILGETLNEDAAWKRAVEVAEQELSKNTDDIYARFNLSVALYYAGDYSRSVAEFEKVEKRLPFRTLWYQIEPIQAYYKLGNYSRVFALTDKVLKNHNRAFSELYIIRGDIYKTQGNRDAAKAEYEKAVMYNKNLAAAQNALNSLQ